MSTIPFAGITGILWFTFFIYWVAAAMTAKKTARRNNRGVGITARIIIILGIFFAFRLRVFHGEQLYRVDFKAHPALGWTGLTLCMLGFATAIWARVYLGRNWGMPMSLKEEPELVTTGPYRYVRHPIYSGFLLAALGSIFSVGLVWIIPFCVFGVYFIYSSFREDRLMAEQFPQTYSAYKKRTKRLIPFVI
jgi:protein-S-isoprenylcysteine O-methyltransferase Ste14